jgi:hypothetical protein
MESVKVKFSTPAIKKLIKLAFPEATSRRPVRIEEQSTYFLSDYWDSGSRNFCKFIRLSDMSVIDSSAVPVDPRNNPMGLAIATVNIPEGYAVIEHSWFVGKDCGYSIIVGRGSSFIQELPEGSKLLAK